MTTRSTPPPPSDNFLTTDCDLQFTAESEGVDLRVALRWKTRGGKYMSEAAVRAEGDRPAANNR